MPETNTNLDRISNVLLYGMAAHRGLQLVEDLAYLTKIIPAPKYAEDYIIRDLPPFLKVALTAVTLPRLYRDTKDAWARIQANPKAQWSDQLIVAGGILTGLSLVTGAAMMFVESPVLIGINLGLTVLGGCADAAGFANTFSQQGFSSESAFQLFSLLAFNFGRGERQMYRSLLKITPSMPSINTERVEPEIAIDHDQVNQFVTNTMGQDSRPAFVEQLRVQRSLRLATIEAREALPPGTITVKETTVTQLDELVRRLSLAMLVSPGSDFIRGEELRILHINEREAWFAQAIKQAEAGLRQGELEDIFLENAHVAQTNLDVARNITSRLPQYDDSRGWAGAFAVLVGMPNPIGTNDYLGIVTLRLAAPKSPL